MSIDNIRSWGMYPRLSHNSIINPFWRSELPELGKSKSKLLPFGYGKSYGDSCLNENGTLIVTQGLNKIISFDDKRGVIRCEAGVTLAEILDLVLPRGWFLAATPGTKHISVGGALANDVHGKNHHKGGTFGCHVNCFELLRSDGNKYICSPNENVELFRATIGGLGLTGLVTWVDFRLKPAPSEYFAMEAIKFRNLDEFFAINEESEATSDYTVSWTDTTARGKNLGRGIYNRGNHADPQKYNLPTPKRKAPIDFPITAPFINKLSVKAFNFLYYNKQLPKQVSAIVHYNPFFYPLDAVNYWNRAYGNNGFLQYQFVVPFGNEVKVIKTIMTKIADSGMSSFLTVLKTFGHVPSPGMLSFPRPGVTMAVDFRMTGNKTLKFLEECDSIVKDAGGVLYPAKDARMSAENFQSFYPQWVEFAKYIDPLFSSSFWRRVTEKMK